MTWIEITGTLFGLLCVILTIRRHIACWPTGIVNIAFFFVMFWRARLYPELVTYSVFFILSIYGWIAWVRNGPDKGPLRVEIAPPRLRLLLGAVIAAGSPAFGFAFRRYTPTVLPYWDSLVMVMSLAAQWALARRFVENWILWIAVDVIGIAIYASRALYVTSGLYAVYLVLAILGLREWLAALRSASSPAREGAGTCT